MTIIMDYTKLWIGGGYVKDNPLENSLKYIEFEAEKRHISKEIMELAITEIFLKCAQGHQYPLDECPCGCGIDKSGTAITHAILARMLEIENNRVNKFGKLLEARSNKAIISHIEMENRKYMTGKLKPSNWFVRGLKWFFLS